MSVNRRQLLQAGAAAAVLSAPATALASTVDLGGGPWWLLAPMKPGDQVGFDWRLQSLKAYDRGAWVLTVGRGDQSARIHICYHQGSPRGVAHTDLLDLVLMDGGQGDKPTTESLGRVLRQLAVVIRENELDEAAVADLSDLLTHGERVQRYGPESLV